MRLDLFLKASRLSSGRSAAQALCDAGAVSINGVRAKSAHVVRVDDQLEITRRDRRLTLRVVTVPLTRQTSRADAPGLYEVLLNERLNEEV